ncbi:MAG TPA: helix-turn-helix domain-containing protein [Candidatus Micrarchaeia archaeon]|nr:helix-turn-helix domain-containing protein [Candidatus Micrarchaeia archaeon]
MTRIRDATTQGGGRDPESAAFATDRQIAEASAAVGVSPRVVRYWEQLGVVRPTRGPHGRRHFTRHDLLLMSLIRALLDEEGASIGDLRLLREAAERQVAGAMVDPLLRVQLLFMRQAAEAPFLDLMAARIPPPLPGRGGRVDHGTGPRDAQRI